MKIGILWDLDGTLLDTLADLTDAVNHVLAQHGLPLRTPGEIRRFLGNGARNLIHCALPEGFRGPEEEILQEYIAFYNAHSQIKTGPYPGISDALARLGEKYPMAVVSNKPDETVKLLGKTHFPALYALGERADCPRKPAPDMVLRAMEQLGVDGCIFVGDSEVDIVTARNAGVPCLSVLWGFRDRDVLESAGAAHYCENTALLPQVLEKMIGEYHAE